MRLLFKNFLHSIIRRFFKREEDKILMLMGQLHAGRVKSLPAVDSLAEVEFKVYSQWGEDGILQYLISRIPVPNPYFIEFGVENYLESNTRFLLAHDNWSGLVMDGSNVNVNFIRNDDLYWRYELKAIQAFITRENINQLIREHGPANRDIGLLSIDIDGNDYWVWQAIDAVSPRIVVGEYNAVFGATHSVTVPYRPDFVRRQAHYSHLYFGASLRALCELADSKGYHFVGINSASCNAFFIRKDLSAPFRKPLPEEVFVPSKSRESRDRNGQLTYLNGEARLREIGDCVVHDLHGGREVTIRELYGL